MENNIQDLVYSPFIEQLLKHWLTYSFSNLTFIIQHKKVVDIIDRDRWRSKRDEASISIQRKNLQVIGLLA
jgi:hypothetical protein